MPRFFDSNILLYAFGQDTRGDIARALLQDGGLISVQCLNEFVNVASRKLSMTWDEIEQALDFIHTCCPDIIAINLTIHHQALALAQRYRISFYDALIVAAALDGQCDTLFSEDMQNGLVITVTDGPSLTIKNPFASS